MLSNKSLLLPTTLDYFLDGESNLLGEIVFSGQPYPNIDCGRIFRRITNIHREKKAGQKR